MILTIHIVTKLGTIAQTEDLPALLTSDHAGGDLNGAITLFPFIGVSISFDSEAEIFGANQNQILHIVSIQVVGLSSGRALSDGSNTVPNYALIIKALGADRIENSMVDASFIETLANLIPYESTHFEFPPLIVQSKHIMM